MDKKDMPVGFAMALAMNSEAMKKFSMLDEKEQKRIIEGTHSVNSKNEMHSYVNSLVKEK